MLERDGDTAKYIAPDGKRYRVYDVVSIDGRGQRVPLEDSRATHRIFKPAAGAKQAAVLRDAGRGVSDSAFAEQLARAGYIGKHIFRGQGSGDPR